MRRLLALVLLEMLVTGCQGQEQQLPQGSFAGSTAAQQALTVDVAGSQVRINGHKTDRRKDEFFVDRKAPHTAVRCKRAPEHELRCEVVQGGRSETVELMRL